MSRRKQKKEFVEYSVRNHMIKDLLDAILKVHNIDIQEFPLEVIPQMERIVKDEDIQDIFTSFNISEYYIGNIDLINKVIDKYKFPLRQDEIMFCLYMLFNDKQWLKSRIISLQGQVNQKVMDRDEKWINQEQKRLLTKTNYQLFLIQYTLCKL
ncbi:hypothetical protein [Paenibacillus alkalitolerans]|uniref:hypothetical protein n=1 Tax=Paenibacillus alkalitolerans TaxID=2799335 RepID=UPI0018F3914A|nr:hypothetical protein [Paenibacillus alkalitolerans]